MLIPNLTVEPRHRAFVEPLRARRAPPRRQKRAPKSEQQIGHEQTQWDNLAGDVREGEEAVPRDKGEKTLSPQEREADICSI